MHPYGHGERISGSNDEMLRVAPALRAMDATTIFHRRTWPIERGLDHGFAAEQVRQQELVDRTIMIHSEEKLLPRVIIMAR